MEHTYLLYVGLLGCAAAAYLWIRDARIFARTALPGYRKAAYYGVGCTALALTGLLLMANGIELELLGLILILGALYISNRIERERDKVWSAAASTADRLLGRTTYTKEHPKKK